MRKKITWSFAIGVLLAEALVIFIGIKLTAPKAVFGYLIRTKPGAYQIAYQTEDGVYNFESFDRIEDALKSSRDDLGLVWHQLGSESPEIERLWMEDRYGTYVVLWKTVDLNFLHQATFYDYAESQIFIEAIRRGSYTPSPFGHAVMLKREQKLSVVNFPALY